MDGINRVPRAAGEGGEILRGEKGHPVRLPERGEEGVCTVLRHIHIGDTALLCRGRYGMLRCGEMPLFNHFAEAQLQKQVMKTGRKIMIPPVLFRGNVDGNLPEDGGKPVGISGRLLPRRKLFADALLDVRRRKGGVDLLERAEGSHQVIGRLLPDAGHAGDIIGGIPHESLQVDNAFRLKAVFGTEKLRGVDNRLRLAALRFDEADTDTVGNQLQAVPVAGDDDALPALFLTDSAGSAQNVIRLIAGAGIAVDIHLLQHLTQDRHLHGQILRHGLTLGLVIVKGPVAECFILQIKGYGECIGRLLGKQTVEDVEKAEYGIGGRTVRRIEKPHPVIGPVGNAVAVYDHILHAT